MTTTQFLAKSNTVIGALDLGPLQTALIARGLQLVDIAAVNDEGLEMQPPEGTNPGGENYLESRTRRFAIIANNSHATDDKVPCVIRTTPSSGQIHLSGWTDPANIG